MSGFGRWCVCVVFGLPLGAAFAQNATVSIDSDHDGLSDRLEQELLDQFVPDFRIGAADCAGMPATFRRDTTTPTPVAEDGTIYGQAFPLKSGTAHPVVELHYYHLWSRDCGAHGHPLDTEHVAVLVVRSSEGSDAADWKASYWYAAAHEDTVCDVSRIAHASTLGAERKGATVWISPGKHGSYLKETMCSGGCGADRCERMEPLKTARVINLGEPQAPMNGSTFVESATWPLLAKMRRSNFPEATLARMQQLPADQIGLYNAGRHPTQGIIAISFATGGAIEGSGESTTEALSVAGADTTGALSKAGDHTGNALGRSLHKTGHALGISARHVGKALALDPTPKSADRPK